MLGSLGGPLDVTAATTNTGIQTKRAKKAFSNEHRIEPINATVDKVWKAIPGYNGFDVNMKASYKKVKKGGKFDTHKIAFREVSPNVHLEDLAAEPIYRGNPEKPLVALLINVAWGNEYIPTILNVLNESKVKATFFYDGG